MTTPELAKVPGLINFKQVESLRHQHRGLGAVPVFAPVGRRRNYDEDRIRG